MQRFLAASYLSFQSFPASSPIIRAVYQLARICCYLSIFCGICCISQLQPSLAHATKAELNKAQVATHTHESSHEDLEEEDEEIAIDTTKYDPYEKSNRKTYEFNNKFDKKIVKPMLKGYDLVVPSKRFRTCIYRAMENLNEPLYLLNFLLQGNIPDALRSLTRFMLNSTVGLLGLLDAGAKNGIPPKATSFSDTLYRYGANTGSYVVLPLWGPRTSQSTAGLILDIAFNPMDYVIYPNIFYLILGKAFTLLTKRDMVSDTIDEIQSMSTDEYSSVRSLFVQSNMLGRPECKCK